MPLDGEDHARAEHEDLERNEDYRDPIHYFEYFLLLDTTYREGRYFKTLLQRHLCKNGVVARTKAYYLKASSVQ